MSLLVIIHGAPAVGKLTIARCVQGRLGGLLYDNHSSLELIKPKIPYGSPGFADAVWDERMAFFQRAFEEDQDVIFTLGYDPRKHTSRLCHLAKLCKEYNVKVFSVYLYCDFAERMRRATNSTRQDAGKPDAARLQQIAAVSNFASIPNTDLAINTGIQSAQDSCVEISEQISLWTQRFS